MTKKNSIVKTGFTFRRPDATLDALVTDTIEAAQSNAAFASERNYSHIELPLDWNRAYDQGFRVVPVVMTAGPTHRAWKPYRNDGNNA